LPSIGQTWILASIGAVVEMGILSTLKRLLWSLISDGTICYLIQFQPFSEGIKVRKSLIVSMAKLA
jgi:hypothetical protein